MSDSVKKYFENSDSTIPNRFSYNKGENVAKNGNILNECTKSVQDDVQKSHKKDEVVERVKRKFDQRSKVGIEKYGTTLYDSPDGFYTFLNHLAEEMMDGLLYLEKLKMQYGLGERDTKD